MTAGKTTPTITKSCVYFIFEVGLLSRIKAVRVLFIYFRVDRISSLVLLKAVGY